MRGRGASTRDRVKAATGTRSRRRPAPSAVVTPGTVAKVRSGRPSGRRPSRRSVKRPAPWPRRDGRGRPRAFSCPRRATPAISPGGTTRATSPRASSAALSACGHPPPGLIRCTSSAGARSLRGCGSTGQRGLSSGGAPSGPAAGVSRGGRWRRPRATRPPGHVSRSGGPEGAHGGPPGAEREPGGP